MFRVVLMGCLCALSGPLMAGASVPKEPAVDEALLAQAAAAGSQVAELALLCGWEEDTGLVLQAKTTALMLATQAIQPDSLRFATMTRVLDSAAMAGHAKAARRQVGNGGCVDAREKAKWTSLRKHTQTLLATPPPPRAATAAPPAAPPKQPAVPAPPPAIEPAKPAALPSPRL
jgi:hypothetical protein